MDAGRVSRKIKTSPRREVLRFGELTASRLMKAAEFKRCVDATFDDQELQQLNRFGERTARMLMRGAARIL